MVLRIADDGDTPAIRTDDLPFRHTLFTVVGSFAVNVGFEHRDETAGRILFELDHVVDERERADDLAALTGIDEGTSFPFEMTNRFIAIDSYDEDVALT